MKKFPNEAIAPQFDVDIFWHYHILDTMKYAVDCDNVFGYFLHHFPYLGLRGEDDEELHERAGVRTQELYESIFGDPYFSTRSDGTITEQALAQRNDALVTTASGQVSGFAIPPLAIVASKRIAYSYTPPISHGDDDGRSFVGAAKRIAYSYTPPISDDDGDGRSFVRTAKKIAYSYVPVLPDGDGGGRGFAGAARKIAYSYVPVLPDGDGNRLLANPATGRSAYFDRPLLAAA
jgi:hypothetical protein